MRHIDRFGRDLTYIAVRYYSWEIWKQRGQDATLALYKQYPFLPNKLNSSQLPSSITSNYHIHTLPIPHSASSTFLLSPTKPPNSSPCNSPPSSPPSSSPSPPPPQSQTPTSPPPAPSPPSARNSPTPPTPSSSPSVSPKTTSTTATSSSTSPSPPPARPATPSSTATTRKTRPGKSRLLLCSLTEHSRMRSMSTTLLSRLLIRLLGRSGWWGRVGCRLCRRRGLLSFRVWEGALLR
ncbi:hypothetical protein BJ508DRAFT_378575 [Ascobolus immersus RN42]|uniref:Uncharacterized protein n=1 Tax=Ascobolus immersus RN42 TaxID=1160509 RepID=A0A3N4I856_ASCIM|nr:hypothetical protein BJ508DRAFT_378575 [Ascobolus immersus RN42]